MYLSIFSSIYLSTYLFIFLLGNLQLKDHKINISYGFFYYWVEKYMNIFDKYVYVKVDTPISVLTSSVLRFFTFVV